MAQNENLPRSNTIEACVNQVHDADTDVGSDEWLDAQFDQLLNQIHTLVRDKADLVSKARAERGEPSDPHADWYEAENELRGRLKEAVAEVKRDIEVSESALPDNAYDHS